MRLYSLDNNIILQYGIGLIGSSVSNELMKDNRTKLLYENKTTWDQPQSIIEDLSSSIRNIGKNILHNFFSLHIVWTAGKAGFLADVEEIKLEIGVFEYINIHIYNLFSTIPLERRCFYMVSSAGGLFEGQTCIDHSSKPNPKRPYGILKLEQENKAIKIYNSYNSINIYRPSSVFSFNSDSGRKGLINTIIKNTKLKKTTFIFGNISTLRDYILDDDIAKIIYEDIINENITGIQKFIIASGKPASIYEIIQIIQRYSNETPYFKFSIDKSNAENITYNLQNIRRAPFGLEFEFLIKKALLSNID